MSIDNALAGSSHHGSVRAFIAVLPDADCNEAIPIGIGDAQAAAATGRALLADLLDLLDSMLRARSSATGHKLLACIAQAAKRRAPARRRA